jgi:hypothetical protein
LAAHPLETTVKRFFDFDFLTPLVTSMFLFDIPSMLIPAIRLGPDLGSALQPSFEAAWPRRPVLAASKGWQGASMEGGIPLCQCLRFFSIRQASILASLI